MTTKSFLITGATGFLGRHVLEALQSQSPAAQLYVLVRKREDWFKLDWTSRLKNIHIIEGGVLDTGVWLGETQLQEISGIFHLAALVRHSRDHLEEVYETNVQGTLNMVRAAQHLQARMVFVSTSGTVGCFSSAEESADENYNYCLDTVKNWPYYHSKILAEQQAGQLAKDLGVELVTIRPPVLLGPGDHRFRATGHVIRHLRGKLPFLLKGGMHFIDIRDAASAIVRSMLIEQPKPVYHLSGTACSVADFFQMIEILSGVKRPRLILPAFVALSLSYITQRLDRFFKNRKISILPDPVVIEMASCYWGVHSKYAKQDLSYESRDPHVTLRDTILWLRDHHPMLSSNLNLSNEASEKTSAQKAA